MEAFQGIVHMFLHLSFQPGLPYMTMSLLTFTEGKGSRSTLPE